MRTHENSPFRLNKTYTRDWYDADEVDKRIAQLEEENKLLRDEAKAILGLRDKNKED